MAKLHPSKGAAVQRLPPARPEPADRRGRLLVCPAYIFFFFPLPRDCLPRSIAPPSSPPTPLRLPCPRPAPAMLYEPSREVFERSIDEDWDDWLALWLL